MIKNLLFEACKKDNISIDKYDAEAHIDKIVENALETDQRVVLNEYSQKHLTA